MPESLRSEAFEALLRQLGPDRELAGARYEQLRRRLTAVFEYRHCRDAAELADETLDRAARKIEQMDGRFEGDDPARFVFGVAWNVARESFRRPSPAALPDRWDTLLAAAATTDDPEREHECLDRCLQRLDAAERDLVLEYHQGERSARIRRRSEIAGEQGLSPNALRIRIHRLTARLRECVARCLGGPEGVGERGHA
jgi:DNA-directed RNA polymerase specialized sigma24 family protein